MPSFKNISAICSVSSSSPPGFARTSIMNAFTPLFSFVSRAFFSSSGVLSVNDLILKATINSLLKYPKWNTSFDGDKLISHSSINLGIAIALEQGLIVPAILDSQNLDLISLASKSKDLGNRARGNGDPLSNQELTSGTFSTSNLGMFGTHSFTAIIVPPQSGIIALGEVKKEAKVVNDDIQIRQVMYATLSADHRVGDGAEGAVFMKEFKDLLEKPSRLLL